MRGVQKTTIEEALACYGATLTEDGAIARDGKALSVRVEVVKARLRVVGAASGLLLASYPASRAAKGIADFVEKFWYWKPRAQSSALADGCAS